MMPYTKLMKGNTLLHSVVLCMEPLISETLHKQRRKSESKTLICFEKCAGRALHHAYPLSPPAFQPNHPPNDVSFLLADLIPPGQLFSAQQDSFPP